MFLCFFMLFFWARRWALSDSQRKPVQVEHLWLIKREGKKNLKKTKKMNKGVKPFALLDLQLFKIEAHPVFCFSQGMGAGIKWNLSQRVVNILLGCSWKWGAEFVRGEVKDEEIRAFWLQTHVATVHCHVDWPPQWPKSGTEPPGQPPREEQLLKGVCVCVFGFSRCGCCHAASSGYVICHTGSRQAQFNLYWGTDKWVMTLEVFLLGDRSRDWWSTRVCKRDRRKLFFFFPPQRM